MYKPAKTYELRQFDTTLLVFQAGIDDYGQISITGLEADKAREHLLPPVLFNNLDEHNLFRWLDTRKIPKNRQYVQQILDAVGVEQGDTLGLLELSKGLSVNDSFWIVDEGFTGTFDEYNLYDTQSEQQLALAITAYTGETTGQALRGIRSPELSTDGTFPKAWVREDESLHLYKAGTEGFANAGNEPYSEYFASQLAAAMGIDAVAYDLTMWHGKLASTCPLMNSKDLSFVPFLHAVGESRFPISLAISEELQAEMASKLRTMFVFDALIANFDRHGGNFGIIRDNATGDFVSFAPLFDHNVALFSQTMEYEFEGWTDRAPSMLPSTAEITFEQQLKIVVGEGQLAMLQNVKEFQFCQHPVYQVDAKRLEALNTYIERRIDQMLGIKPIDEKASRKQLHELYQQELARPHNILPVVARQAARQRQRG